MTDLRVAAESILVNRLTRWVSALALDVSPQQLREVARTCADEMRAAGLFPDIAEGNSPMPELRVTIDFSGDTDSAQATAFLKLCREGKIRIKPQWVSSK